MKWSEESLILNSKEAGVWGDQTFGGWMDGVMEEMRKMGMDARDKQSWRGSLWAVELLTMMMMISQG